MSRDRSLLLALLVAITAAALAAACVGRAPARFQHLTHLVGVACGAPGKPACLDCNSCHSLSPQGSPHSRGDATLCASCHHSNQGQVSELLARPRQIKPQRGFSHDQHLAMNGIQGQCVSCHAGVVEKGGSPLPPMSQCFTCHEHEAQWKAGECAPCHTASELSKTLPQTFLRHDQEFARHHGQAALADKQLCQSCHTQADCSSCHDTTQELSIERRRPENITRTLVHGGDFETRHALEAKAQPTRCVRCHEPQTCESCHRERGVSGNQIAARNPHPPGWVGTSTGSSSFHGREARRDILLCAGCHDQGPATNCIRCHKVGGYGGNPHPNGWQSTQSPSDSMCRYCHG
jgi:Cytochrome c7 and related cytochrome c